VTESSITAIRDLLPGIRQRSLEIENSRRLPPDLVASLKTAGIFRLMAPKSLGGDEIDYPLSVQILSELAKADGAAGWSLMIGCETPQLFALLQKQTFEQLYADGPDITVGGAFAPKGAARPVEGGFEASGQWGFASGCEHADYLFGNCVVTNPDAPDQPPALRCMLLPRADWQILDTWHTSGLRGTGSHDIAIDKVFVPGEFSFDLFGGTPCVDGPLFRAPLQQFALHIAAVALGIAEGALEELTAFAIAGKTRLYARSAMADGELFQYRLGHAEADAQAARAVLETRVAELWQQAQTGDISPDLQMRVMQTEAWVVEMSARVVDACYIAGGGSAIYDASPLQRRLRDIHTLTQHASAQESVFANAGAKLLGDESGFGL
jgi:alkylation response protein AidB-like acyl-CoA dehydrogenase